MSEVKFNIGSVVELRSGGQCMAVESVDESGVQCVWTDAGRVRRDKFPDAALRARQEPGAIQLTINTGRNDGTPPWEEAAKNA